MAHVTYKDVSPGMQRMVAPKTFGSGRVSVGNTEEVGEYYYIDVDKIIPFKNQARTIFNEEELERLSESIKEVGVRQPISVIHATDRKGFFEVVSGERRLRASKMAGLLKIPCIIVREHHQVDEIALIENIQRSDLHPVELGRALVLLMGSQKYGGQKELSQKIGFKEAAVSEYIRLAKLPETIVTLMLDHNIRAREVIRALLKAPHLESMKDILSRVIADDNRDKTLKKVTQKQSIKETSVFRILLKAGQYRVQKAAFDQMDAAALFALKEVLEQHVLEIQCKLAAANVSA